jgi:hypothetical protein
MVAPQTYDPGIVGKVLPGRGFIPADDHEEDPAAVRPPSVRVQVEDTNGRLRVELCSRGWDYRRIRILNEQCSLTDSHGHTYQLAEFQSNDYANRDIGASRFIQYFTSARGPVPANRRHTKYGSPHKLRVAYLEDGRRYVAEGNFAATYPVITLFNFAHRLLNEP